MRVTHISPTVFGAEGLFGGGERYPLELSRALASHVDCELVTFGRRAREVREPSGLRVRVLKASAFLGRHPAHPVALGLPSALVASDVVHAHHMRSTPSRAAAVVGWARRQPAVVTDHGLGGGGWAGLLPRLFARFLVVSRFSAATLGVPESKTRVIYGGADPSRFHPDAGARRRGVLFVGRLTPHKGLDRLIEALPQEERLTIVGTKGHDRAPPESDYPCLLTRLAAGKDVHFAGAVREDDLPAVYRSAVALVLPSVEQTCYGRRVEISELLGLSLLEAMSSGTPVICSRLGGLPEVVRDGETGFLVEPGNVEQLRDRISTLCRDPALATRMGQAARALVLERFTWEACAHRCLEVYEELGGGGLDGPHTSASL
jgi:glycosyltransferase involved in cell wall biosynthesis